MSRFLDSELSRRTLIQTGLLAGAGATLALPTFAAARSDLVTKAIPATGEKIPVMGIGTNSFRNANHDELSAMLKRMHELGGTVIDTAAGYGESEGVIGQILGELGLQDKMFLATKFNAAGGGGGGMPPPPAAGGAPPPSAGAPGGPGTPGAASGPPRDTIGGPESFERSLDRLKTRRIDLMMVHQLTSVEALMPTLIEYKKAGRVRYIGITTPLPAQHPQLLEYVNKYPVDFIQVSYSLANREAATSVFPIAAKRKVAVMVALPLGGRRGSLINEAGDRQLPKWAADFDAATWGQFFLKYVVSHPAVTCAIPGSTKVVHVEDNQAAGHGRLPTAAQRLKMEQFWDSKA
jgi:aryl-alcohol dehydrogenase-like predicted oxidoreductase